MAADQATALPKHERFESLAYAEMLMHHCQAMQYKHHSNDALKVHLDVFVYLVWMLLYVTHASSNCDPRESC